MAKQKKAGKSNNPTSTPDIGSTSLSRERFISSAATFIISILETWNREISAGNGEYTLTDPDLEELWSSEKLGGRQIGKFLSLKEFHLNHCSLEK